jgi:cytolysin-activating lysine-acyltransferase
VKTSCWGLPLWATLSDQRDQELIEAFHAKRPLRLPENAWKSGNTLWLMELVSPFASLENKLIDKMMGELARSVFQGRQFRCVRFNPDREERELVTLSSYELPYYL